MKVGTKVFFGLAPKLDAANLPSEAAQVSLNAFLNNGSLQPFHVHSFVLTPSKVVSSLQTIYRFGQNNEDESLYWFVWQDDVDVVKGQVLGDTEERTYFTGDSTFGHPRVTKASIALIGGTDYPMQSYRLGPPAPTVAPGLVPVPGSQPAEDREYVYTWVTGDDEQSAPSPPAQITIVDGKAVQVTTPTVPPAGYNITKVRIYRTALGTSTGSDFQFVNEHVVATGVYTDDVLQEDLGETLPSIDWQPPPATLKGLVNMPGGIMAGFDGYDVWFSVAYQPHAWRDREPVAYPIVGLGVYADTLVVATRGKPVLMTGNDTQNLSVRKLDLEEECVSKRSIASTRYGVMYSSNRGIVLIGPGGASLATEAIIDKDFWQTLNPSSIHAYGVDGKYVGFYDNGVTRGGFVFDPNDDKEPFSMLDVYATAGFDDVTRDGLFLAISGDIRKWEGGAGYLNYTWRSKKFRLDRSRNFGFGMVIANSYANLTARYYAGGVLVHTQAVTSRKAFRLPSGYAEVDWEIELTGIDRVTEAWLAQDSRELQSDG